MVHKNFKGNPKGKEKVPFEIVGHVTMSYVTDSHLVRKESMNLIKQANLLLKGEATYQ